MVSNPGGFAFAVIGPAGNFIVIEAKSSLFGIGACGC